MIAVSTAGRRAPWKTGASCSSFVKPMGSSSRPARRPTRFHGLKSRYANSAETSPFSSSPSPVVACSTSSSELKRMRSLNL